MKMRVCPPMAPPLPREPICTPARAPRSPRGARRSCIQASPSSCPVRCGWTRGRAALPGAVLALDLEDQIVQAGDLFFAAVHGVQQEAPVRREQAELLLRAPLARAVQAALHRLLVAPGVLQVLPERLGRHIVLLHRRESPLRKDERQRRSFLQDSVYSSFLRIATIK